MQISPKPRTRSHDSVLWCACMCESSGSWLTCQTRASIEQVYSIPAQSWRCHMLLGGVWALGRPGLINLLLWGPVIAFMAECWRDWFSDQSCPCVCEKDNGERREHTHTGTGGSMLIVSLEWWNTTEIWLDHLFLLLSLFISFFRRSSSLHLSNISLVSRLSIFSPDITLQPSFISFSALPGIRKLLLLFLFIPLSLWMEAMKEVCQTFSSSTVSWRWCP